MKRRTLLATPAPMRQPALARARRIASSAP